MTSTRDGRRLQYDLAYYDDEFFEGKTGEKGRNRLVDSGVYRGHAVALTAMFPEHRQLSVLGVADGIGHASKHLAHLGWHKVTYSDISPYALTHCALDQCGCANCRAVVRQAADVRDLSCFANGGYDVVWCINLLGYLDGSDRARALQQLSAKAGRYLAIQTAHLSELQTAWKDNRGRTRVASSDWWDAQLAALGWEQDWDRIALAAAKGHQWPYCLKRSATVSALPLPCLQGQMQAAVSCWA